MAIRLPFESRTILAGAFLIAGTTTITAATLDPVGDFLPTYIGPRNGDLDVVKAAGVFTGRGLVRLDADHGASIGKTPGAAYVWGIDRGQGTALLADLDPPVGKGVTFDAVAIINSDRTGAVIDLIAGTPPTLLDPSAVGVKGRRLSVTLAESLLPSTGLPFAEYRYNLWPRFAPDGVDPANNTQISDFAPDASTFTAVPIPAALGLQIAGLALLGAVFRRRSRKHS